MPTTRPRRFVRRTAMVLGVVALLATLAGIWLVNREPPELQRSRALRLGMTRAEVESAMGPAHGVQSFVTQNGPMERLLFGKALLFKMIVTDLIGLDSPGQGNWPVDVLLDHNGRVVRIGRGDEIEEAQQ